MKRIFLSVFFVGATLTSAGAFAQDQYSVIVSASELSSVAYRLSRQARQQCRCPKTAQTLSSIGRAAGVTEQRARFGSVQGARRGILDVVNLTIDLKQYLANIPNQGWARHFSTRLYPRVNALGRAFYGFGWIPVRRHRGEAYASAAGPSAGQSEEMSTIEQNVQMLRSGEAPQVTWSPMSGTGGADSGGSDDQGNDDFGPSGDDLGLPTDEGGSDDIGPGGYEGFGPAEDAPGEGVPGEEVPGEGWSDESSQARPGSYNDRNNRDHNSSPAFRNWGRR